MYTSQKKYKWPINTRQVFNILSHKKMCKSKQYFDSINKQCKQEYREKGILKPCWRGCKLVQSLWKSKWRFLRKLIKELQYDSVILLLDIHQEDSGSKPQGWPWQIVHYT
jgi:hypothetical protein